MIRFVPFAVLATIFALLPDVPACAPAPRHGESVEIRNETALIIWDEATKTEHFIRRATFQSTSPEFGFLVPTPSKPELAKTDDAVFGQLSTYTAAKVEYRTVRRPRPKPQEDASKAVSGFVGAAPNAAPPRGVEVLDVADLDGLEAVVLKFHRGSKSDTTEDAKELADWLKERGFEFGPQLVNWLKPYIENDWVMTAFRIARQVPVARGAGPGAPKLASQELQGKAIRMSFKADQPFYPYREPEEAKDKKPTDVYRPSRFLRVFFLGAERFSGTLGTGKNPWVASTAWSDKLNEGQLQQVAATAKLPDGALKNAAWLTEFEDRSSPRHGTDEVYYAPRADKTPVHRPTIVHEVVEYYDVPSEGSATAEAEQDTPRWVVLAAAIGGAGFLAIFGGLLFLIMRQR